LRAGKSDLPGWAFYEDEPLRVVRVGSDPAADWPVVAAGIAPEVVRFACKSGVLYFRAAPGVRLRVNGARAWDGVWLPAQDGMRLDVGTTSFDVIFEHEMHSGRPSVDPEIPDAVRAPSRPPQPARPVNAHHRYQGETALEVPIPPEVMNDYVSAMANTQPVSERDVSAWRDRRDLDDTLPSSRTQRIQELVSPPAPNKAKRSLELVDVIDEEDDYAAPPNTETRAKVRALSEPDPLIEPEPLSGTSYADFERHPRTTPPPRTGFGPRTERRMAAAPSPFDDEDTQVVLPPMLWPNTKSIRRLVGLGIVCAVAYFGWVYLLDWL
jgi:hypothetical protein